MNEYLDIKICRILAKILMYFNNFIMVNTHIAKELNKSYDQGIHK